MSACSGQPLPFPFCLYSASCTQHKGEMPLRLFFPCLPRHPIWDWNSPKGQWKLVFVLMATVAIYLTWFFFSAFALCLGQRSSYTEPQTWLNNHSEVHTRHLSRSTAMCKITPGLSWCLWEAATSTQAWNAALAHSSISVNKIPRAQRWVCPALGAGLLSQHVLLRTQGSWVPSPPTSRAQGSIWKVFLVFFFSPQSEKPQFIAKELHMVFPTQNIHCSDSESNFCQSWKNKVPWIFA